MNNKFKRALSSVLAFVMLLSCMMVVNVSSVAAATLNTNDTTVLTGDKTKATAITGSNCTIDTNTDCQVSYTYAYSGLNSASILTGLSLSGIDTSNLKLSKTTSTITFQTDGEFDIQLGISGKTTSNITLKNEAGDGQTLSTDSNNTYLRYANKLPSGKYTIGTSAAGDCAAGLKITVYSDGNSGGSEDTGDITTVYEWKLADISTLGLAGTLTLTQTGNNSATLSYDGTDYTLNDNYKSLTPTSSGVTSSESTSGTTKTITYTVTPTMDWFTAIPVSQTATISITDNGGAVSGINTTTNYTVGSTVSFTVTPPTGKVVDTVKANGITLTATDGTYSFTVAETNSVAITYKDEESSGGTGTSYIHNFTNSELTSDFYTFTDCSTSDSKGSVTYNGSTLTKCLKMESKTTVSFTASAAGTLTLVLYGDKTSAENKTIKVDEKAYIVGSGGTVTVDIVATGEHTITKGDSINLFYIDFTENGTPDTPDTPDTQDITITVIDSETSQPITAPIYYWTTNKVMTSPNQTNEYKLINTNGVIEVTKIAAGTVVPEGDSDSSENTPASDMSEAIGNGVIYVTAVDHVGQAVTLPTEGNKSIELEKLPNVDLANPGVYTANVSDIISNLLKEDATYSYQNPYINSAKINGFEFSTNSTVSTQIFKIMQKANTRNQEVSPSVIQATVGCEIKYTAPAAGTLTITAKNASTTDTQARGFTISNGTTTTTIDLTNTELQPNNTDKYVQKEATGTCEEIKKGDVITITVTGASADSSINISNLKFTPSAAVERTITITDTKEGGTATFNVGDTTLATGANTVAEDSIITITVKPDNNKTAVVTINGVPQTLTDNSCTYTVGVNDVTIDVTYVDNSSSGDTNALSPLAKGETIDFTKEENLKSKEEARTSDNKAQYYAAAVVSGSTSVVRLSNDSNTYIQFVAGDTGNISVDYYGGALKLVKINEDGTTSDVSEFESVNGSGATGVYSVEAGTTYKLLATGTSNVNVTAISLSASTAKVGKNIASIKATEVISTDNSELLNAYGASNAKAAVRVIGQLIGIGDAESAAAIDKIGVKVLNCTYEQWEDNNFSETNVEDTLVVGTVYAKVYDSSKFDSNKLTENGYTGEIMNYSTANAYFDLLVYSDTLSSFKGASICTYTMVGEDYEYYNANAALEGVDFE